MARSQVTRAGRPPKSPLGGAAEISARLREERATDTGKHLAWLAATEFDLAMRETDPLLRSKMIASACLLIKHACLADKSEVDADIYREQRLTERENQAGKGLEALDD